MEVTIDSDVKAVAEFMQRTIRTERLMGVARRLAEIAGLLWDEYEPVDVPALRLVRERSDLPPEPVTPASI